MHKFYNEKLKFRLNLRLSILRSSTSVLSMYLLILHLRLGTNKSLSGLLNFWKYHTASKVSGS